MILIGLENCKPCEQLHARYPKVPFVEVPRHAASADMDVYEVKKALGRLGIREFPVLLNDAMTVVLPLKMIEAL